MSPLPLWTTEAQSQWDLWKTVETMLGYLPQTLIICSQGRVLQAPSTLSCLWAERKPSAESWRATGVCYRMPLAASAMMGAKGTGVRYQRHVPLIH